VRGGFFFWFCQELVTGRDSPHASWSWWRNLVSAEV
jgi:hypothetical protein